MWFRAVSRQEKAHTLKQLYGISTDKFWSNEEINSLFHTAIACSILEMSTKTFNRVVQLNIEIEDHDGDKLSLKIKYNSQW